MGRTPDYDQILIDVSAYIPDGVVDFTNPTHVRVLKEALSEMGYLPEFINEFSDSTYHVARRLKEGESEAAKEAHKKGLEHIGWGYWANRGNLDIAVAQSSEDGSRLIPIKPKKKSDIEAEEGDKQQKPETKPDQGKGPQQQQPQKKELPNPAENPVYTTQISPNASVYAKNKGILATRKPFSGIDKIVKNPLYPRKYSTILERMMNTKYAGKGEKIEYYTEGGGAGAGTTKSKAGEIAAMMFTTMTDEEFDKLYPLMYTHLKELDDKKIETTLDLSWLVAARNARNSTLQRFHKQYPGGKLVATAWDVQAEVEAMGMPYDSKEESTDVFYRITTPDGETHFDQSSLKKDLQAALRNPGAGKMKEWDPNLPKEIDPDVFYAQRANDYLKAAKKFFPKKNYAALLSKGGSKKAIWKAMYKDIEGMAKKGDKNAKKWVHDMNTKFEDWNKRVCNEFVRNSKLVKGVLENVVEELPIRGIVGGKESITIGNISFDKFTAKEMFGTEDYREIKDRIFVITPPGGGTPYLSYRAGKNSPDIPIAKLRLKDESGRYSTSGKFILDFHQSFGKRLAEAHKTVYQRIIEILQKLHGEN